MPRLSLVIMAGATLLLQLEARQQISTHNSPSSKPDLTLRGAATSPHHTSSKEGEKGSAGTLDASKIAWMHVPKAGTSFANVLVTWGCPRLPDYAVVDESYSNKYGMFVPGFMEKHKADCASGMTLCGSGHIPILKGTCNGWDGHKGNFVAMFRQPEQRTLSGFNHDKHDIDDKSVDLLGYAHAIAGCSVRMMNGHRCGEQVTVTQDMVSLAVSRLETGFAFVGLTDEWALSVCLFHIMYGSQCHKREFQDVRPGAQHTSDSYDTKELKGWTDPFDGPLYERAYVMFWANVAKYGASRERCSKVCSEANGAFDD